MLYDISSIGVSSANVLKNIGKLKNADKISGKELNAIIGSMIEAADSGKTAADLNKE